MSSRPNSRGKVRIIAGRFKGRVLQCPNGPAVRPTGSLVRGAIFNMLGNLVHGAGVLELYAGTGALGLEALSRGATSVVLVEGDRRAADALQRNVEALKAGDQADVVTMDSFSYLDRCRTSFGLILADPPYQEDLADGLLGRIAGKDLLQDGGMVVIQEPAGRVPSPGIAGFELLRTRRHGRTQFTIYGKTRREKCPKPPSTQAPSTR